MAKVFVRQCLADIRINDVPVMRRSVDGDLSVQSPVNYLIESSGQQSLRLQLMPMLGDATLRQGAQCSVELWCYDGSGPKLVPVEQLCSTELVVEKGDVVLPRKFATNVFHAEVAHRILRWGDCVEIENSRQTASEVGAFFEQTGQMLAAGHYDEYTRLIGKREHDICTALALDEKETRRRNEMLFGLLSNGFVLEPMKGGMRLALYADKRAVTIVGNDLKPALRFKNMETGELLAIDLLLGRKRGSRRLSVI